MLREDGSLIDSMKMETGTRDSATVSGNSALINGLNEVYTILLIRNGLTDTDVSRIYASGMISSPYGIHEVAHLCVPLSVPEIARRISPFFENTRLHREIWLIPGLRTRSDNIAFINNVRGEETRVIGVVPEISKVFGSRPVGVVCPGSHTHTLLVRNGVIEDELANFSGELLSVISNQTILSPIMNVDVDEYNPEMVRRGVSHMRKYGITRALYICHTMRLLTDETPVNRVSYANGVILGGICQSIDRYCQERWYDLSDLLIVADAHTAALYKTLLSNCRTKLAIHVREITNDWIPELEGFRILLKEVQNNKNQ